MSSMARRTPRSKARASAGLWKVSPNFLSLILQWWKMGVTLLYTTSFCRTHSSTTLQHRILIITQFNKKLWLISQNWGMFLNDLSQNVLKYVLYLTYTMKKGNDECLTVSCFTHFVCQRTAPSFCYRWKISVSVLVSLPPRDQKGQRLNVCAHAQREDGRAGVNRTGWYGADCVGEARWSQGR